MTLRELEVTKATVVKAPGTDHVILFTDVPGPFSAGIGSGCLLLGFEAPHGTGEDYLWHMLGLKAEVIER